MNAGAHVVVTDRDADRLADAWSHKPHTALFGLNVTDERECITVSASSVEALGGLDGVFNSAGVSDVVAKATDISIDDWQRVVDVNLRGSFLVARTAGRYVIDNGGGSIVLVYR